MSTEPINEDIGDDGLGVAHFNYRVLLTTAGEYEIRDVYYGPDGEITGWSSAANSCVGEDLDDLRTTIGFSARALTQPVLVESELPGYREPEDSGSGGKGVGSAGLGAIVTSTCSPRTIGELGSWVGGLSRYGVGNDTELLEGAQLHPEGEAALYEHAKGPGKVGRVTLGDLKEWITFLYGRGLRATTELVDSEDLAIDLRVVGVSAIECGDCELLDVVVDVHEHEGGSR